MRSEVSFIYPILLKGEKMRKKLQKLFLLFAFFGMLTGYLGAIVWTHNDIVVDWGKAGGTQNSTFDQNLQMAGTITISQDVYIIAYRGDVAVTLTDDVIIIPATDSNNPPPAADGYSGKNWGHLIFFADAGNTITVEVTHDLTFYGQMTYSTDLIVTFSGQGQVVFKLRDDKQAPDYVGGQVSAGLNRGVIVSFTGDCTGGPIDDKGTVSSTDDVAVSFQRGGTRVYILMDQTKTQAMDNGINKVVFQRTSYLGTEYPASSGLYPYRGQPTGVVVGPASFITYLSTNPTGEVNAVNPLIAQQGQEVWSNGDYGAIAFDPSHYGQGRLYLEIQGDPLSDIVGARLRVDGRYNFQDGAVVVCGNFVPDFTEDAIRNWVYLNAHAGRRAIFRVIDNLAYQQGILGFYDPQENDQRGLLVINKNTTVPALAADPYLSYLFIDIGISAGHPNIHTAAFGTGQDAHWYWAQDYSYYRAPYCYWANQCCWPHHASWNASSTAYPVAFNTRTGFVLGSNGWMDIYPATFFDHVACNWGEMQYFAVEDSSFFNGNAYNAWDSGSQNFKWRNPAAFHVDGLNYYQNINSYQRTIWSLADGAEGTIYNDPAGTYFAYDPTLHAHINCYGNGSAYFRCAADSSGLVEDYGPYDTLGDGNYNYLFWIDVQAYNGQYIPSVYTSAGEGEGVFDLEGKLSVYGHPRNDAPRVYSPTEGYAAGPTGEMGVLGMPTLNLDYRGLETGYYWSSPDRPLVLNHLYYISNSPHWFCNSIMELYDVIFRHTDVTKAMSTDPSVAPPAIVGGEAKYFNDNLSPADIAAYLFEYYQYPILRFFGSQLQMHESLVASGVRFVAKERERITSEGARTPTLTDAGNHLMVYGTDADNTSVFRFYDHGDKLDTMLSGYGRMFMLGSGMNRASSYNSTEYAAVPGQVIWTNDTYASGFINVYRGRKVPAGTPPPVGSDSPWASVIKLSIQSADDNDDILNLKAGLNNDDEAGYNRAHHLFLLSRGDDTQTWCCNNGFGKAYMSIGWTFTFGSDYYYPWEMTVGEGFYHFPIDSGTHAPASCSVDGNFIYFGGTDWKGNKAVVPVTSSTQGSIIYANHGGRFTVTQPLSSGVYDTTQHGYDMFVDTVLAYRIWGSEPLFGVLDVPKDQVIFGHGFGRQPYDINITLSKEHIEDGRYGLRVRTYNTTGVVDAGRDAAATGAYSRWYRQDLHSGEEVVLPWGRDSRTYDTNFIPSKTLPKRSEMLTRYTANIDQPPAFPADMFFFTAGDYVTQLKVSGATQADPINLLVTGNNGIPGAARIKEIVSIPTNPIVHGEGAHGLIFLNHGGRVGLGDRDWNEHSENAWNLLGKDYVTIAADGDGVVDVNSNLLVTDNGAIVATTRFGSDPAYDGLADYNPRLTFFSEQPYEVRVPKGVELDLGTFAKQLGTNPQQQIIKFGGKLRLIFEPGSTLRFPRIDTVTGDTTPRPVLYMSDDTELVFEGDLEESKGRHMDIRSTDSQKTLIVGHGEIWLNKNAKMVVNDEAIVRVASDPRTPTTDLKISIQRQGQFLIGTEQVAGGAFEVGNAVDMDNYYTEAVADHPINFELVINGPKARFHIDREGFFGLGVGIVNKTDAVMNGNATAALNPATTEPTWNPGTTAWQVQALHNVHKVTVNVIQGVFDHSNIFDGTDRRASLMAVGPVTAYQEVEDGEEVPGAYTFDIDHPYNAKVLGGGNIMMLLAKTETYPGKALVNIWSFADALVGDPRIDGTKYNILGASRVTLDHVSTNYPTLFPNSAIGPNINGGMILTGPADDFFRYIAFADYTTDNPGRKACIGESEFIKRVGYVNGTTIYRNTVYSIINGRIDEALDLGVVGEAGGAFQAPVWGLVDSVR